MHLSPSEAIVFVIFGGFLAGFAIQALSIAPIWSFIALTNKEKTFTKILLKTFCVLILIGLFCSLIASINKISSFYNIWTYLLSFLIIAIMALFQIGLIKVDIVKIKPLFLILLLLAIFPLIKLPELPPTPRGNLAFLPFFILFLLLFFSTLPSAIIGSVLGWIIIKIKDRSQAKMTNWLLAVPIFCTLIFYGHFIYTSDNFTELIYRGSPASFENWKTDYDEAISESEKTNKRIFVLLCNANNKKCRDFDRKVLADKNVKDEMDKLVTLYLDSNKCWDTSSKNSGFTLLCDNLFNLPAACIMLENRRTCMDLIDFSGTKLYKSPPAFLKSVRFELAPRGN